VPTFRSVPVLLIALTVLACPASAASLPAAGPQASAAAVPGPVTADVVVSGEHGALAGDGSVGTLAAACREVLARRFDARDLHARAESFSRQRFRRRFAYLLERVLPARREP